jgi:hypothetical protein
MNIQQGIPADAPPAFAIGLYTPASLLIVAAIALFVWERMRGR